MTVKLQLIVSEDDEDELTMNEINIFNTVHSENNHGDPKGLPGYHPAATSYRPYAPI